MTTEAPPKVQMKVSIRCGGPDCSPDPKNKPTKKLAVIPIECLDKGIEIKCPRCGHRNVFD